jgi:hypothetical protein
MDHTVIIPNLPKSHYFQASKVACIYLWNKPAYLHELKHMVKNTNTYRITARIIGIIYVLGFVVGIGGEMLIKSVLGAPNYLSTVSAGSMIIATGALLWMMAAIGDTLHGVLMFPILKLHNERLAIGYLAFRIMDAVFISIMVLFILLQIPLAGEYLKATTANTSYFQPLSTLLTQAQLYAYDIGMLTLGISGVMLCFVLYKAKLLPRILAIWGLIGYAIIFLGMASEIMGSGLSLVSSLPGGLWELFIGFWLTFKGFNASALSSLSAKVDK